MSVSLDRIYEKVRVKWYRVDRKCLVSGIYEAGFQQVTQYHIHQSQTRTGTLNCLAGRSLTLEMKFQMSNSEV